MSLHMHYTTYMFLLLILTGTTQNPTTELTEPTTASIKPSTATSLLSTVKPSTATPTTENPTPTPGCDMCPGRNDSRGHYWESVCAGEIIVKDTHCPFNTTGSKLYPYCFFSIHVLISIDVLIAIHALISIHVLIAINVLISIH